MTAAVQHRRHCPAFEAADAVEIAAADAAVDATDNAAAGADCAAAHAGRAAVIVARRARRLAADHRRHHSRRRSYSHPLHRPAVAAENRADSGEAVPARRRSNGNNARRVDNNFRRRSDLQSSARRGRAGDIFRQCAMPSPGFLHPAHWTHTSATTDSGDDGHPYGYDRAYAYYSDRFSWFAVPPTPFCTTATAPPHLSIVTERHSNTAAWLRPE